MENFYDNEDSRIQQIFKIILASVVLRTLLLRDDEKTVEIMNVIWTDVNGDNDDTLRDRNDIRDVLKGYLNVQHLILLITIYMKKFLQSDWLRAVQFLLKQCRKELIQCKKRKKTKHSDEKFSKTSNCTRPRGSCNFVSLWKIYSCLFIPNCTRNHVITYTNRKFPRVL